MARQHDPELADFYRRLMVDRQHNHIKANTAVARKLACRAWAVLRTGQPYQLRDLDGEKIDQPSATAIVATLAVPEDVRRVPGPAPNAAASANNGRQLGRAD